MLDVASAIVALLTNAPDLTAAIGKPYTTQMSEAWNMPNDVVYPVLAIDVSSRVGSVPDGISQSFVDYTLKCWYITTTSQAECMAFADALKLKLHLQQSSLAEAELLASNYIKLANIAVGRVPQTAQYQAYLEFSIVA
jgi:hypothetical protein